MHYTVSFVHTGGCMSKRALPCAIDTYDVSSIRWQYAMKHQIPFITLPSGALTEYHEYITTLAGHFILPYGIPDNVFNTDLLYRSFNPSQQFTQCFTLVNSMRPRPNRSHFADDVFKCNFLNENVWIPIKISLKFVPKGPMNIIPPLFQIMAWRRPGDKPLSETMMVRLPTHLCVTRPQWVKCDVELISLNQICYGVCNFHMLN